MAQPDRRPVVLVAEELAPSALAVLAADFEVRHVDGADRSALLPALAGVDAVLVRSATRIDAEALAAADRLSVVARAGIGLDNVDVPAATARGVLVVNAPTSNIVSAAEHAVALLLAVARNVPAADAVAAGRGSGSGRASPASRSPTRPSAWSASAGSACWSPSGCPRSASGCSPTTRTCSRPGPRRSGSGWSAWTSCSRRATSSPSTCRRRRRRSA